jgi:hypothetical protein
MSSQPQHQTDERDDFSLWEVIEQVADLATTHPVDQHWRCPFRCAGSLRDTPHGLRYFHQDACPIIACIHLLEARHEQGI